MYVLEKLYPLSARKCSAPNREWKGVKLKARTCMLGRIRMLEEANQLFCRRPGMANSSDSQMFHANISMKEVHEGGLNAGSHGADLPCRCTKSGICSYKSSCWKTNHIKLKLGTENTKQHYLELSFELNPSWDVSTWRVPPRYSAGTSEGGFGEARCYPSKHWCCCWPCLNLLGTTPNLIAEVANDLPWPHNGVRWQMTQAITALHRPCFLQLFSLPSPVYMLIF